MKKYVFIYYNQADMTGPPDEAVTKAWMDWFAQLGDKLVDAGNPFGPGGQAVDKSGVMSVKDMPATGYSIVKAKDMDEATGIAKDCPVIQAPGAVCVYEALPM